MEAEIWPKLFVPTLKNHQTEILYTRVREHRPSGHTNVMIDGSEEGWYTSSSWGADDLTYSYWIEVTGSRRSRSTGQCQ